VYFVPLAPVRDPGLVPSTIDEGIGLQDARDRPLMEHLISQLRERRLLIVLDNFEHLLAGAPVVTQLLQATSALRILVTSRSSLRISGEQECPVPPLAVPDPAARPTRDSVAGCESVRLFAARAVAAMPGFAIDEQNAPAIAQIARRLDGLPLAIELAAARVKLLPPESILARLEHLLSLLTGGSRDLPDRLQTLRATIAWSYQLLTDGARRLLAVCSVFAGGATLEVIETVCDGSIDMGLPVLDGLQELVDQSLLRQRTSGPGPGPVHDAGDDPRVRGRAPAPAAGGGPGARRSCCRLPGPGRVRWPPAGRAGTKGVAGAARRRGTTTSGRRSAGPGSTIRRPHCGWPRRCPRSGPCAVTTPRAGSGWPTCSAWSRVGAWPGSPR
jgi:hypothetical protein